jgi:hypothetical protein
LSCVLATWIVCVINTAAVGAAAAVAAGNGDDSDEAAMVVRRKLAPGSKQQAQGAPGAAAGGSAGAGAGKEHGATGKEHGKAPGSEHVPGRGTKVRAAPKLSCGAVSVSYLHATRGIVYAPVCSSGAGRSVLHVANQNSSNVLASANRSNILISMSC